MNKTFKIITIVAVSFVVVGMGLGLLGNILGGGYYDSRYEEFIPFNADNSNSSRRKEETILEPFSSVYVDANYMDLSFRPSPTGEWKVTSLSSKKNLSPTVELVDGILYVSIADDGIFRNGNLFRQVIINYPAEAAFDVVDISIGASDIDLQTLTANELAIDAKAGDLSMNQVVSQNTDLQMKAGSVDINNSTLNNLITSIDLGDLDAKYLTCENLQGNLKMGSVSLEGDLTGKVDFDLSAGDVEMHLTRQASDYDFDLHANLGDIEVNGRDYGRNYTSETPGTYPIRIDAKLGSIEVDFDRSEH